MPQKQCSTEKPPNTTDGVGIAIIKCQQWSHQRSELRLRFLPRDDSRETLRPRGLLRLSSRSLERELYESEPEPDDSEAESEPESDDDSDPDSEEEGETLDDRFFRFFARSVFSSPFSRSFSLASKIRSAIPVLFLNSSGTSTDGFPSAFDLARRRGLSSCAVREGRETYGLVDLHSYVKWPVPRHF